MITVTKLNGQQIVLNAELLEFIETMPDTMLSTTTGKKIYVKESVDEIISLVTAYKRRCAIPVKIRQKKKNLT